MSEPSAAAVAADGLVTDEVARIVASFERLSAYAGAQVELEPTVALISALMADGGPLFALRFLLRLVAGVGLSPDFESRAIDRASERVNDAAFNITECRASLRVAHRLIAPLEVITEPCVSCGGNGYREERDEPCGECLGAGTTNRAADPIAPDDAL